MGQFGAWAGLLFLAGSSTGQSIDLAASADPSGRIAEDALTGAFAEIGRDPDGLYSILDGSLLGTGVTVFPNGTEFGLGELTYDAGALSGSGTETVAITALDLSDLFTAGSSTGDISAGGLGDFFFDAPLDFEFGSLDAADTATFVDGEIASVDLTIDADFVIDATFGVLPPTRYDGTFSIQGDRFSLFIQDTEVVFDFFGNPNNSTLTVEIEGRIAAIPAPGTIGLLGLAGIAASTRRRGDAP